MTRRFAACGGILAKTLAKQRHCATNLFVE
jgi:hypothetical protein